MRDISRVEMVERAVRTRLGAHGLGVSVVVGALSHPRFAPDDDDVVQLKATKQGATEYFEFLKIVPIQEIEEEPGPRVVADDFVTQALAALEKISAN